MIGIQVIVRTRYASADITGIVSSYFADLSSVFPAFKSISKHVAPSLCVVWLRKSAQVQ